jgi:hypothetical protein
VIHGNSPRLSVKRMELEFFSFSWGRQEFMVCWDPLFPCAGLIKIPIKQLKCCHLAKYGVAIFLVFNVPY